MYHELHGGGRREAAVDTPAAGSEHEGVGEEGRSKPRDHREARESSSTRAARNGTQACRGPRSGGRGTACEEVRRGASRLGPRPSGYPKNASAVSGLQSSSFSTHSPSSFFSYFCSTALQATRWRRSSSSYCSSAELYAAR